MIAPKPSRFNRQRLQRMTVCVAALANKGKSLVCIADKAITYGHTQWDSDSSKIIELPTNKCLVLFSGDDEELSRVLGRVIARESEIGNDVPRTKTILESEYQEAMKELKLAKFITPQMLTQDAYIAAISQPQLNPHIEEIAKQVNDYAMECQVLVCGFDAQKKSFILMVISPGIVLDMTHTGFQAIGGGWEKANSKLLYSGYRRAKSTERIMYEIFDAKAFAEMTPGVGTDWDTRVVTDERVGWILPANIDNLIVKVWNHRETSPFYSAKKSKRKPPPKDWKKILSDHVKKMSAVKQDEPTSDSA
jgi:hypothetical protein